MTYENAVQWLVDNVPPENYDSYNDWYKDCLSSLKTPHVFNSPQFNNMLHSAYMQSQGEQEETEDEYESPMEYHEEAIVGEPTVSVSEEPRQIIIEHEEIAKPKQIEPEVKVITRKEEIDTSKGAPVQVRQVEGRKKQSRVTGFLRRLLRRKNK